MTLSGMDVLLVGQSFQTAHGLTDRLHRRGLRCHFASSMRTACKLLSSVRVDLLLSNTRLSDGTGFGLLGALAGLPVAAFLCLSVENGWFWLPAIDGGNHEQQREPEEMRLRERVDVESLVQPPQERVETTATEDEIRRFGLNESDVVESSCLPILPAGARQAAWRPLRPRSH
jgi:hypothetical protein